MGPPPPQKKKKHGLLGISCIVFHYSKLRQPKKNELQIRNPR